MLRRGFLASAALLGAGCPSSAPPRPPPAEPDELDRALALVHTTAPEFDGGLSNHAPMAAEALLALGHPERIAPFVAAYDDALEPAPAAGAPIGAAEQPGALGDFARFSDWLATFEALVAEGDAAAIFAAHFDALAPGYAAAAFHGVLRAAHALRAIDRAPGATTSAPRRAELAHGLAYWAARHLTLPGEPGAQATPGLGVEAALAAVPIVPPGLRNNAGLIYERLTVLDDFAPFAAAVAAVDLDAQGVEGAISALAAASARLYLATPGAEFSYLHAVTGSSALRLMLPHLSAAQRRAGLGYLFRSVAAIHATHALAPGLPEPPPGALFDATAFAGTIAAEDDEHSIKLGEAALREYAIDPRPELIEAAARHAGI